MGVVDPFILSVMVEVAAKRFVQYFTSRANKDYYILDILLTSA